MWDAYLKVLKPAELKVVLTIIRQTIGWQKDRDWISTSQFVKKTGLSRKAVYGAIEQLIARGLIAVMDSEGRILDSANSRKGKTRLYFHCTLQKDKQTKMVSKAKRHQPTASRAHVKKIRNELIQSMVLPR